MGRRSGFEGFIRAAARASAAAQRERARTERAQLTQARQVERQARMARNQQIRDAKEVAKLAKQQYLDDRIAETEDLNEELNETLRSFEGILQHTLSVDDRIGFSTLKLTDAFPSFKPPTELLPGRAPERQVIAPLTGFSRFLPRAKRKHQQGLEEAEQKYQAQLLRFNEGESWKRQKLAEARTRDDANRSVFEESQRKRNAELNEFEAAYMRKEPEAIVAYCEMVLARSEYPSIGFPQVFKVAFNAASQEVVVEYDLPKLEVVPEVAEYRYVKTKDAIESKPRKAFERKQIYQDVVASIALRTIHELLEADQASSLSLVTFTGVVDTLDPATGKSIRVPIISVRASRDDFLEIKLDRIDKAACLKNLGAKVSARPEELQAVKPIVEFNMVDPRFIDQGNALAELESRPNLLELTPAEFEVLVANLFGKMGLESKLTRASRDGGVDAVAFDTRPVLGGKVVIQAKRYRNTVGVEAVRDLYGTMLNEGANKGILVTTSGYGPDAYNFSKDKPVELIDGGGLLFLLREHAGVDARIAT